MNRVESLSFALGINVVVFIWSLISLFTADDPSPFSLGVNLGITLGAAYMAIWTWRDIKRRVGSTNRAHIAADGVHTVLRCSGCNAHLVYIEHGHDLERLMSLNAGHTCVASVAKGGDQ